MPSAAALLAARARRRRASAPGAIVAEALFAGAFGALLARALLAYAGPAVALAVPLFVALVDIWSVAMRPVLATRERRTARRGGADLRPAVVGRRAGGPATRLGLPDAIFLAVFTAWALGSACGRG